MKTMKSKFYSLALAAGMLTLTACSDDNTGTEVEVERYKKGTAFEIGFSYKL